MSLTPLLDWKHIREIRQQAAGEPNTFGSTRQRRANCPASRQLCFTYLRHHSVPSVLKNRALSTEIQLVYRTAMIRLSRIRMSCPWCKTKKTTFQGTCAIVQYMASSASSCILTLSTVRTYDTDEPQADMRGYKYDESFYRTTQQSTSPPRHLLLSALRATPYTLNRNGRLHHHPLYHRPVRRCLAPG